MKSIKLFFILILTSSFLFSGCLGVNYKFEKIRDNIFARLGKNLNSEVELSIGSVGIWAAGVIGNFESDDDMAGKITHNIDNVQLGVYQNYGNGRYKIDINYLKSLNKEMMDNGYKLIICSIEHNQATAIFADESSDETLHRMFIINFDHHELVLAEIEGDLNEALAEIIKNKKFDLNI